MHLEQTERVVRQRLSLRIGPETARYIERRLAEGAARIEVMGLDARTGVPERRVIDAAALLAELEAPPTGNTP